LPNAPPPEPHEGPSPAPESATDAPSAQSSEAEPHEAAPKADRVVLTISGGVSLGAQHRHARRNVPGHGVVAEAFESGAIVGSS
jgi:hypothetical protein